jgi:hypothetical protein
VDLPLPTLIDIVRKRKKLLTCTQDTTRAKLEMITTRHAMALIKTNELIRLLARTLSTIKHVN